jgi:hypothetical protein
MHPLKHDVYNGISDKMAKVKVSCNTDWIISLYLTLQKLTYMPWNTNLNIVDRDQILVAYNNIIPSSYMTYQHILNKSNVARRVALVERQLLTQPEQPSSPSCFVKFVLLKLSFMCSEGVIQTQNKTTIIIDVIQILESKSLNSSYSNKMLE